MKNNLLLGVWLLLLVAGCGKANEAAVRRPADGGLIFVTTLGAPPYSYFDEKKQDYAGTDVEIVRAAAKKLGLRVTVRQKAFQEMIPAVRSGAADCAGNGITITPARARDVDFSIPYASAGSAFLYRAGAKPVTMRRARDLRVGTMMASTCHFYLCNHNIDPYCYNDYKDAVAEFDKGNLDAVFYDLDPVREKVKASNGAYAMTPLANREHYGIVVRKDFPEFLLAVNEVIAERRAK